jgi:hypothetical protein
LTLKLKIRQRLKPILFLKSLLSGNIKNEYKRITTSVAGDDIHKWDSFVYMVCTILRDSQMSPKEKLEQLPNLIHLKDEAPPKDPEAPAPAKPPRPQSGVLPNPPAEVTEARSKAQSAAIRAREAALAAREVGTRAEQAAARADVARERAAEAQRLARGQLDPKSYGIVTLQNGRYEGGVADCGAGYLFVNGYGVQYDSHGWRREGAFRCGNADGPGVFLQEGVSWTLKLRQLAKVEPCP